MKEKTGNWFGLAVCLIILCSSLIYIWVYQGIRYSYYEDETVFTEYEIDEMLDDTVALQTFVPESHYIKGVYLYMINLAEDRAGDFHVDILDNKDKVITSTTSKLENWQIDCWNFFELDKRLSTGAEYRIKAYITGQTSATAPYLLRIANPNPDGLTVYSTKEYNGSDQSMAIRFRYAKPISDYEKLAITLVILSVAWIFLRGQGYIPNLTDRIKKALVALILLGEFILYIPNIAYKLGYINLDDSWRYFLNVAGHEGYIFGKNVYFTYGPLGYLCYMMNLPDNGPWYAIGVIIWCVVIGAFVFLLFREFALYKRGRISALSVVLSGLCIIASYTVLERDNFLLFLLILCVGIFHLDKGSGQTGADKNILFVISNVIITLMFFAKFSTFTSGVAFLVLYLLYEFLVCREKKQIWLLIPGLLAMPVCYLIYNPSVKDLANYVIGILKISSGWMETQQYDATVIGKDLVVLITIIVCYLAVLIINLVTGKEKAGVLFACAAPMFFVYKYATTRHGLACGIWLFGMIYSLVPLTVDFRSLKKWAYYSATLCIAITALSQANTVHNSFGNLKETLLNKAHAWTHLNEPGIADTIYDESSSVSEVILDVIGSDSVAIYPHRVALKAVYPQLNVVYYPSVQNVNEFIPWMDEKTANWFEDEDKAPKFLLVRDETIDSHIKYLDNPLTWQSIKRNYTVVAGDGIWCLLQQKTGELSDGIELIGTERRNISEVINVPSDAEYVVIHIDYDLWGKLKKMFYHVYTLNMVIRYDDGSTASGRIMRPNLESGFDLEFHPQTLNDLVIYFGEENHKRIESISFGGRGIEDLSDSVEVEWYRFRQ